MTKTCMRDAFYLKKVFYTLVISRTNTAQLANMYFSLTFFCLI